MLLVRRRAAGVAQRLIRRAIAHDDIALVVHHVLDIGACAFNPPRRPSFATRAFFAIGGLMNLRKTLRNRFFHFSADFRDAGAQLSDCGSALRRHAA
jgi:hypothetical protein